MSTEPLNADIKTRVPSGVKAQLAKMAAERHLDTSDLVREALREFLAKEKLASEPTELTQPPKHKEAA